MCLWSEMIPGSPLRLTGAALQAGQPASCRARHARIIGFYGFMILHRRGGERWAITTGEAA